MIRSRTGVILFISGILFSIIVILGGYLITTKLIWKDSGVEITNQNSQDKSNTSNLKDKAVIVKVVAVAQKLEKNENVIEGKLKFVELSSDQVPINAVTNIESLKGMKAAIALEANTIISAPMIYSVSQELKETDRLRDYELSTGMVGGLVAEGSYIDIEFVNPKGDTFVVLSKKLVKKTLENNKIILLLSITERKLINYALTEQKVQGGSLQAVVYFDERQPASKVDYPASKIIKPIKSDSIEPIATSPSLQQSQTSSKDAPLKGGY